MKTAFFISIVLIVIAPCGAQLSERPGHSLDDPIDKPRDLSGLSIKNPRIRVVHTTDPAKAGGSMYLQRVDPWLGYQLGRNLTQREFRQRDGVYGDAGKLDGIRLPDGVTHIMSRSHVNSCATCHNSPYRDGGAGATISKNAGSGRNTPHMFGAGLVEMIGQQLRLKALAIADDNRDGWISRKEATGKRCQVESVPGKNRIDYGRFDDINKDGRPDLNDVFAVIYVDENGKRIAFADDLNFPGVAGYNIEVQVFGFGHLFAPVRPPIAPTLRSFTAQAWDIHSGLQAFDPTTLDDADGDGLSQWSNAGALQCITSAGRDRGKMRGPTKISRDDPDRDGYCEEISEGDLDLAEWYLLNHPAPAREKMTDIVREGERVFEAIGCANCHVPDWHLEGANPGGDDYTKRHAGDRRFFELIVQHNAKHDRLEGRVKLLARKRDDQWIRNREAHTVRGVYSDFKYHDLGPKSHQLQFDGTIVRQFRTTPLWGVGSTAPYDHDGASLNLDAAIRRHGGEAAKVTNRYVKLDELKRLALLTFLRSLVLYQTDQLSTDIDGDGAISEHFMVAGMDTGLERFNPEWLFNHPARIEGPIENSRGETITSFAITNLRDAYGLDLPLRRDSDADGFSDAIDSKPETAGYRDGRR